MEGGHVDSEAGGGISNRADAAPGLHETEEYGETEEEGGGVVEKENRAADKKQDRRQGFTGQKRRQSGEELTTPENRCWR